jgi:uncharacterized protein with FMN-binding domain
MRTGTIKSLAALVLTGVGSAFVLGFRTTSDVPVDVTPNAAGSGSSTTSGSTGTTGSSDSSGSTDTSGSTGTAGSSTATWADGTWTGAAVSEPWGPFQVQVVVSKGTITDVSVVESPTDRHSSRINRQAVPILTEETLQSQAASVDMVSGATWTSDSYATSLQSALDEAAAAA